MKAERAAEPVDPPVRGLLFFGLALAGAAAGTAAIVWDYTDWSPDQKHVLWTGPFLIWAVLILAQTATWAVAVPILGQVRAGLAHLWEPRLVGAGVLLWLVAILGGFAGAYGPDRGNWHAFEYLDHRTIKITVLSAVGSLVAIYGVLGIFAIYWELKVKLRAGSIGLDYVDDYLMLKGKLELLLLILGSALGLTILTVGAERNVVTAWAKSPCGCDSHFPSEYVLIYGFYFTTLLAFAYAPVQIALAAVARRIRDSIASVDDLTTENLAERYELRQRLEDLLGLNAGTLANFRAGLAILTPLIGSLTGLLLGAGK